MLILPSSYYEEICGALREIKKNYPLPQYAIQFGTAQIRHGMIANADDVDVRALHDGGTYLELHFSPNATAFAGGHGRELKNHGDIYLTIWRWNAKQGVFWQKNGWEQIIERRPSVMGGPLIEWEEG